MTDILKDMPLSMQIKFKEAARYLGNHEAMYKHNALYKYLVDNKVKEG